MSSLKVLFTTLTPQEQKAYDDAASRLVHVLDEQIGDHQPAELVVDLLAVAAENAAQAGPTEQHLSVLRVAAALSEALDFKTREAVQAARKGGAPWQDVGDALGVTRQAAQQRYGSIS